MVKVLIPKGKNTDTETEYIPVRVGKSIIQELFPRFQTEYKRDLSKRGNNKSFGWPLVSVEQLENGDVMITNSLKNGNSKVRKTGDLGKSRAEGWETLPFINWSWPFFPESIIGGKTSVFNEVAEESKLNYAKAAVVLLLFDEKGQLLVTQRHSKMNTFADMVSYVFPGGHVDENEKLEEAVCRECEEETGICLKKEDLKYIAVYESLSPGKAPKQIEIVFFSCKIKDFPEMKLQEEEVQSAYILPKEVLSTICYPFSTSSSSSPPQAIKGVKLENGKYTKSEVKLEELIGDIQIDQGLGAAHRFALSVIINEEDQSHKNPHETKKKKI